MSSATCSTGRCSSTTSRRGNGRPTRWPRTSSRSFSTASSASPSARTAPGESRPVLRKNELRPAVRQNMNRCAWRSLLFPGLLLSAGCTWNQPAADGQKKPPPEVLVGEPVVRQVKDYEDFTGRTEAFQRVDIRARVTGYLEKTHFTEGALVEEDDLLFQIDPRPYQAELARAEAALAQAQAHVERLERDYSRAQPLLFKQAISREEFDRMVGERDEARASVGVAQSNVRLARLNVEYTEVRAPFTGRISRRLVDPGNLVKADETILTYLVALEPLYIYFDVDERTLLRQLLREGRLESARQERLPIRIGLSDEDGYPHEGVVNFVDNRV